ncbi:MAG TPA: hypothetical protein VIK27_02110 [Candidatus Aquilonibacter sp.]
MHNTRRFVGEDVEIAGERLATGDTVVVILAAANRDPAARGRIFSCGFLPSLNIRVPALGTRALTAASA